MFRQTLIFFLVMLELFLMGAFHPAEYFVGFIAFLHPGLYGKKRQIMLNVLTVNGIKKAFTKRNIVNRIQEIGFSHSVIPYKTIKFSAKTQLRFIIIFKIDK